MIGHSFSHLNGAPASYYLCNRLSPTKNPPRTIYGAQTPKAVSHTTQSCSQQLATTHKSSYRGPCAYSQELAKISPRTCKISPRNCWCCLSANDHSSANELQTKLVSFWFTRSHQKKRKTQAATDTAGTT